MHFSAKRGIAIACCPSVGLSVRLSVTVRYRGPQSINQSINQSYLLTWPKLFFIVNCFCLCYLTVNKVVYTNSYFKDNRGEEQLMRPAYKLSGYF